MIIISQETCLAIIQLSKQDWILEPSWKFNSWKFSRGQQTLGWDGLLRDDPDYMTLRGPFQPYFLTILRSVCLYVYELLTI